MNSNRNGLLDQNKLIAAFFVVLLHAPLSGVAGQIIESLARFAVPFFFMISGYYAHQRPRNIILKKAGKTALLLISSVCLYILWDLVWSIYRGTVVEKLTSYLSLSTLIDTFVFNSGLLLGHLWFILALLYCYLTYYLISKRISYKCKMIIAAVLLVVNVGIGISFHIFNIPNPAYYTRNFLFTGLPFFIIGDLFGYKKISFDKKEAILISAALVGIVLSLVQRFWLGSFDLYLGSIFTAVSIFALSFSNRIKVSGFLSTLGAKYSGSIYILHVIVINSINMVGSILGILASDIFLTVRPVATLFLSLLAAFLLNKITVLFKKKLCKHK